MALSRGGSQCPSGHFVLFYGNHTVGRHPERRRVSMPFRAFCSFLLTGDENARFLAGYKVSMPFRAFCSFLQAQIDAVRSQADRGVSMPFRAFCSFLPRAVGGVSVCAISLSQCPSGHFVLFYTGGSNPPQERNSSLNALPGILFFSTAVTSSWKTVAGPSLNALPGILFFSTSTQCL